MEFSIEGAVLGASLPLERLAEQCLLHVAWGGDPLPLTRELSRTVAHLATYRLGERTAQNRFATLVNMPALERVVLALAHRELTEADLLTLVSNAETARSLLVMREVVAHPSFTPVVLARTASQGWKGSNSTLSGATLAFLASRCGAYGAAAAFIATRWPSLGDSFVESVVLDLGAAGPEVVEIFRTLATDSTLPVVGGGVTHEDVKAAVAALVEQAQLLATDRLPTSTKGALDV